MKEIKIKLHKVTSSDKDVLFRLLQYSLYEESSTDGNEIDKNGLFEYKWFDAYFSDPSREAFLIKEEGSENLLGFAMVCCHTRHQKTGHSIAEFMVLPKYRRNKIGQRVAYQIFSLHDGYWEVKPSDGSLPAYLFWENTIKNYVNESFEVKNNVFCFQK